MESNTRQEVLKRLNAGDAASAITMVGGALEATPDDVDAQYLYGLALLIADDVAEAIEWLLRVHQQASENSACLCNLGVACLRAERLEEAIMYLSRALELRPDYAQARYSLGSAYIANKQPQQAEEYYRELCRQDGSNADYLCALADAVRESGQWKRALPFYRQALEHDPDLARAHTNLGPMLAHFGQPEEALAHCRRAVELTPDSALVHKNLGDGLLQMDQLDEAMEAYADAFDIDPENGELCVAIGRVWLETNALEEAHSWFHKASLIDGTNIAAQCGLANINREAGNGEAAIELLTPLLQEHPDEVEVLLSLADALWDEGEAEGALEHLRRVQTLQPQRLSIYGKIGQILSSSGEVKKAVEAYQCALNENPASIPALSGMATTERGKLDPSHVATMERLLESDRLRAGARASLHSGLAFYYDGIKESEKAAGHSREANRYQWESRSQRGWHYNPEEYEAHIGNLISTFDRDYFTRLDESGEGDDSEVPVFIVAMPRSGTTLTEQILARHSKALGIGERNFASQSFNAWCNAAGSNELEALARLRAANPASINQLTERYLGQLQSQIDKSGKPGVERVIDKMPDNYSLVGWILTLFPRAKIIHVRRDPRDVALSCWMTQFGSIRWASHTDHLAHRIQQYQRIMAHWREVIPERLLEFDYESLVADQEKESRRLVEWIGLEWEPQCLTFYNSDRLVRTASITQVRQPIYNKSVAKWRRYEPYLHDLFDPLAP